MNPNQPGEFLSWLAAVVSYGGPCACTSIRCCADGRLRFVMCRDGDTAEIAWRPGPIAASADDRSDCSRTDLPIINGPEEVARPAREQLRRRLGRLLAKGVPPLLERRNREVTSVSLDAELLRLFRGALVVGETVVGDCRLSSAAKVRESIRLVFAVDDTQPEAVLRIVPAREPGPWPIVATSGPLALTAESLASDGGRMAAEYTGYLLHLRFGPHMVLEAPAARRPPDGSRDGPLSFFDEKYTDEIAVFETLIGCGDQVSFVGACERACLQCLPRGGGATESSRCRPWNPPTSRAWRRNVRFVYGTDMDVMVGDGEERFGRALREAVEGPRPGLVVGISSCLAKMLGDNIEQVLVEAGPGTDVPIYYLDGSVAVLDNHAQLWERLLGLFPGSVPRSVTPSVNLIGFGPEDGPVVGELRALLEAGGVGVNLAILPSFDPRTLPQYGAAWANVLCPSRIAIGGFAAVATRAGLPIVRPDPPCGWRGTFAWLDAVRDACRLGPLGATEAESIALDLRERWNGIRRRAAGERLGIVVRAAELAASGVLRIHGGDWLEAFADMGFGIEVLVLATEAERPGIQASADLMLRSGFDGTRHRIRWVEPTDKALAAALLQGSFSSVYTDRIRDSRPGEAGKTAFSIGSLEMGLAGACRTAERLIAGCRTPFYARYRKHLSTRRRGT